MNILLINHYAGSIYHGMEFRPYYLAREWVQAGHCVAIVAAAYSHVRQKNPAINILTEEVIDGIRYIWLPTSRYNCNGINRLKNMLQFIRQLYKYQSHFINLKPDVVIASSTYPLDAYPARRIAQKANAKFVFELHDLWPLSPMILANMSKYHPFIMLMQHAEDYWCKYTDKVISLLPNAENYLLNRGLEKAKFFYVPNGIKSDNDNAESHLPYDCIQTIMNIKKNNKVTVCYAGSHGKGNCLDILLLVANHLKMYDIGFVLIGDGLEKDNLLNISKLYQLTNVYFLKSMPKSIITKVLSHFDILFIGLKKGELLKHGISPNKLFDYMLAAKPIISAISAGNDPVLEAECGISVEAENVTAIAEAIKKLAALPPEDRISMGKKGREYVIKNHDYKILAKKFINVICDGYKND